MWHFLGRSSRARLYKMARKEYLASDIMNKTRADGSLIIIQNIDWYNFAKLGYRSYNQLSRVKQCLNRAYVNVLV